MGSLNKCILGVPVAAEDKAELRARTADLISQGEDAIEASEMAAQELFGEAESQANEVQRQLDEQAPVLEQRGVELDDLKRTIFRMPGVDMFDVKPDSAGNVVLEGVKVRKDERGEGLGTGAVNALLDWADANGKTVTLTPSNSLGGSVRRLKKFYKRFGFVENKGRNKDFEISDSMYREPDALLQQKEEIVGGRITLQAPYEITLTENSDMTTFIHETSHLFMLMERDFAEEYGITEDQKTLLKYLGAESFDDMDVVKHGDPARDRHEKFADAFLSYIKTGKAPSRSLAQAFASFRNWIMEAYRRFTAQEIEVSQEVRDVFDRMLATDAEIEQMKVDGIYTQFFQSAEQAGMTTAEFKEYQARVDARENKAASTLDEKLIAELTRKHEKEWKAEKRKYATEEEERLREKPVYLAEQMMREAPVDRATVKQLLKIDKIPPRLRGLTKEGGGDLESVALEQGFASSQQMITLVAASLPISKKAEENAESYMLSTHGDILNDGTIEREAIEASQNEENAKALLIELRALNRQNGKPSTTNLAVVRLQAEALVATMPYSEIRPNKYYRAEVKSAKEAQAALDDGDTLLAEDRKAKQITNQYLYKAAKDAKESMDKQRNYLRRTQVKATAGKYSPKDVAPEHVGYLAMLTAAYDFRKSKAAEDKARAELFSIAQWINAQAGDLTIPQWLDPNLSMMNAILSIEELSQEEKMARVNALRIKPYSEMTGEEMQGVYDMARNIRWVGGQLSENANAEFKAMAEKVGANIKEKGKGDGIEARESTVWTRNLSMMKSFGADQIAFANTVAELDGYEEFGPMFENFYQDIIDSTNTEIKARRGDAEKLNNLLNGFGWAELIEGRGRLSVPVSRTAIDPISGEMVEKKKITGAGIRDGVWTTSRRARIMLALYWGSPEGQQAVLDGFQLSESEVQSMLNMMTDKELDLVEALWKLNEEHWPGVSKTAKAMTGVSPPKVEHVPFQVNGRKLPGGYTRLFYNYSSQDSLRQVVDNVKETRSGSGILSNTKHGARHERVGSGGKPVNLDFNMYFQAMEEVNHDVAFAQTSKSGFRLLQSKPVREAIVEKYGRERYESLIAAMNGVVAGKADSASGWINTPARYLRTNATYSLLGLSIRNFVQQPVALTNGMGKVGEVEVISGMVEFYRNPAKMIGFVKENSQFMQDRTNIMNRDIAEVSTKLNKAGVLGSMQHHAFDLATIGDSMVAYPIWIAAYRKGQKRHYSNKKSAVYADEIVAATIGSGLMKDLSPIMMGKVSSQPHQGQAEIVKLITFMGSFFNKTGNLVRDAVKTADFKSVGGVTKVTREMTWYVVAPAVLSALVVGELPDDDDDEGWVEFAATKSAEYSLSMVFLLRDLVALAKGFSSSSPYQRAMSDAKNAAVDLYKVSEGEKELDDKTAVRILRGTAGLFPIPGAGQVARTVNYSYHYQEEGDYNLYHALVRGKKRD